MKGLLLVVAITSVVWALLLEPATSATFKFNLASARSGTYLDFIGTFREAAKDQNKAQVFYEVPMMPPPTDDNKPENYHFIEIESTQGSLTLALKKNDLYMVGYRDKWGGHFFTDAPTGVKANLFGQGVKVINIGCASSYPSIEGKAKQNRANLKLGIKKLAKLIDEITKKETREAKSEAQFLLHVIQMFAEAARFKYIEYLVRQNFDREFSVNPKVISLEENWSKVSKALFLNKMEGLQDLKNETGQPWVLPNLDRLAIDVGLLKYIKNNAFMASSDDARIAEQSQEQYDGIVGVL